MKSETGFKHGRYSNTFRLQQVNYLNAESNQESLLNNFHAVRIYYLRLLFSTRPRRMIHHWWVDSIWSTQRASSLEDSLPIPCNGGPHATTSTPAAPTRPFGAPASPRILHSLRTCLGSSHLFYHNTVPHQSLG